MLGPEAHRVFLVWREDSSCRAQVLAGSGSVVVVLSCPTACGILVLCPGIEPTSPALEGWILNRWAAGEVLLDFLGTDD